MLNLELIYNKFIETKQKVCTDTRKDVVNSFFVCLKGENFDANKMVEKAIEMEARYVLCQREDLAEHPKVICVENSLEVLTNLATLHRQKMSARIIAIGGSNGKTTTKELLGEVFAQKYNVHITPGNFNNHIGVPLTLLQLKKEHEYGIIELGINHPNEMAMLCKIAMPDEGLLTNIGKEHLEGFGDIEGVAKAESELFEYLIQNNGFAFINADDFWIANMAKRMNNKAIYGKTHLEDLTIARINPQVVLTIGNTICTTQIGGDYNLNNILCAISVARYHGIADEIIAKGLESYTPSNNRSQWVETDKNKVLMDCYNANPTSMELALSNFLKIDNNDKVCIIGDMLEMGQASFREHRSILDLALAEKEKATFYFVGEEFQKHKNNFDFKFFEGTNDLGEFIKKSEIKNKYVLLKASRGIKLEKLLELL